MQMEDGAGKRTLHPVQYLALAYGLMPELGPPAARTYRASWCCDDRSASACSPAPATWPAPTRSPSNLPAGATVADLRRALADACPALAALLPTLRRGGERRVRRRRRGCLPAGAEIALLPPVSGG